jgi:hypothetical protein
VSPSPEQLERQIAITRSELAHTLAELQERTNPVAIARRNRSRLMVAGGVVLLVFVVMLSRRRH